MKKLIVLAASRLFPGRSPMKITRRFAVASLLVIALAIVLGAPAPASAGKYHTPDHTQTVKLYPVADSPSPNANGVVTLYLLNGWANVYYDGVGVSVSKLAPNAWYSLSVPTVGYFGIQTDARGKGEGVWYASAYPSPYGAYWVIWSLSFQVYDASGALVLTSNP